MGVGSAVGVGVGVGAAVGLRVGLSVRETEGEGEELGSGEKDSSSIPVHATSNASVKTSTGGSRRGDSNYFLQGYNAGLVYQGAAYIDCAAESA